MGTMMYHSDRGWRWAVAYAHVVRTPAVPQWDLAGITLPSFQARVLYVLGIWE